MARGKAAANAAGEPQTALATTARPDAIDTLADGRVSTVFRWILEGNAEHDVREAIAATFPDAAPGPLIVAAVRRFAEAGEFQPEIMRGWCAEAYREIYRTSLAAGDSASALRAVKLLSQLAGF